MRQYTGRLGDGITLLKFETKECVPCKHLTKTLEELQPSFPSVEFLSVDCEQWPELASKFMVRSVPTCFIVDKNWNKLSQVYGNTDKNTMMIVLKGVS